MNFTIASAVTCAILLTLLPAISHAQMFIRVAPPSVEQQNQGTVTAMPTSGAAGVGAEAPAGSHSEAVLTRTSPVKIVDQNGKEVKKDRWKMNGWRPTFYLNLTEIYDNNIFIQRDKTDDFITSIEPGIVVGFGDYRAQLPRLGQFKHDYEIPTDELAEHRYLYLDYHPSILIFAKNSSQNAVNEDLALAGSYEFTKLILTGQFQYRTLSSADIDAGQRVNRTLFAGRINGLYNVDEKTSLELQVTADATQYDGFFQSREEQAVTSYLNYQLAPKTNLSAGVVVGYVVPEKSANQTYEQVVGRLRWAGSDKVYVNGVAGIEVRESSSGTTRVNSIFDISANYAPFDGTRLYLSTSRSAHPSVFAFGEDLLLTVVELGVQQRFLGRIFATGSVAYDNGDYQRLSSGSGQSRTDNGVSVNFSLGADVTQYAGIQLANRFTENDSTQFNRAFDEDIVSLQLNLTY